MPSEQFAGVQQGRAGCGIRRCGVCDAREQRRGDECFKCLHVIVRRSHLRIDMVRDPAGKREAAGGDGFRRQQGMIQATEPHSDHQHHGQRKPRCELRGIRAGTERHAKSADSFHDDHVRWPGERVEAMHDVVQINRHSSFGPDTLKELRAAFASVDRHTHVHRFTDMHDVGDMLVACGFADPVMDMEVVMLTYADVRELMRDLKAIGAHNVTRGRPAALAGKSLLAKVARNYEPARREGRLPATFEVIYGHAWKPAPRVGPTGRPVIDIKPR